MVPVADSSVSVPAAVSVCPSPYDAVLGVEPDAVLDVEPDAVLDDEPDTALGVEPDANVA